MSGLFDDVPRDILDNEESLGAYAAYLNVERSLQTVPTTFLDQADSADDLRKIIQTPQFTQTVRENILRELETGEYPETAAAMAGIPHKVWREWMTHATNGLEPYYTFWRECFQAEARAQAHCNKLLRNSESGAKYLLERRFSRPSLAEDPLASTPQWRKQSNQEISLQVASSEEVVFSAMKPKDRVDMIAAIAAEVEKSRAIDGTVAESDAKAD